MKFMSNFLGDFIKRKPNSCLEDREIPYETKQLILKAATDAPTAGKQDKSFIIEITDESLKQKLAKNYFTLPYMEKSSTILLVCADCKEWYDAFHSSNNLKRELKPFLFIFPFENAMIRAQTVVTASEKLGLSANNILVDYETKKLFGLPDHIAPISIIVLGYPLKISKTKNEPQALSKQYVIPRAEPVYSHNYSEFWKWSLEFLKMKYENTPLTNLLSKRKAFIHI